MRPKIASAVLAAAVLTGTLVGGAATSASATTGWSGNYSSLKACNAGRVYYLDVAQNPTPCYQSRNQYGTSYHFYYFY